MNKRTIFEKGFTLVELLIVIALIAILSVAVLATINPIEQANKARDAKFKNDSAEVLSAFERYYISKGVYPWNDPSVTGYVAINTGITMSSDSQLFGVRGVGNSLGVLITTDELKASFIGKEPWVTGALPADKLEAITDGSSTNYVCFCPKAVANRKDLAKMKCISGNTVIPAAATGCVLTDPKAVTFCDAPSATKANRMCVPE
jgi:prepilin-type N-terminal cleavage/methylation domain-containing protein